MSLETPTIEEQMIYTGLRQMGHSADEAKEVMQRYVHQQTLPVVEQAITEIKAEHTPETKIFNNYNAGLNRAIVIVKRKIRDVFK